MRDKHTMHVHVELGAEVRPSHFLERPAVKKQDKAALAWIGVDD